MKRIIIFLALVWFVIPQGADVQASGNPKNAVIRMGVSAETFLPVSRNDTLAALRAWGRTIVREQSISEQWEVTIYDTFEDLRQAWLNETSDAFSISVESAMRLGIEPRHLFLPVRETGPYASYAILVHRSSAARDPLQGTNRRLVLYEGQQMLLARFWLRTILAGHPSGNSLQADSLTTVDSPSKAILQVFFHQADAAIVTTDMFDLACELNPQLKKDIIIWSVSPPLINSFLVLRENWEGPARNQMETAVINLHTTPGGQQILNIFQSSWLEKFPGFILNPTHQFILENRHLMDHDIPEGNRP